MIAYSTIPAAPATPAALACGYIYVCMYIAHRPLLVGWIQNGCPSRPTISRALRPANNMVGKEMTDCKRSRRQMIFPRPYCRMCVVRRYTSRGCYITVAHHPSPPVCRSATPSAVRDALWRGCWHIITQPQYLSHNTTAAAILCTALL